MIIACLLTRGAFCSYAACAITSVLSTSPLSPQASAPETSLLPSLSTSYIHLVPRNAKQASSPLTDAEKEKMTLLASRIVRDRVSSALKSDPTLAGSILRLAFHDAATREARGKDDGQSSFTGGSNGSIRCELDWSENRGLGRPLAAVQGIYNEVRGLDFSFADTVALAGAAAVECAGGPRIEIRLGRRDVSRADARSRRHPIRNETDRSLVDVTLPSAALDSDGLRLFFGSLGLSEEEFVALCGAHDLGRHVTLLDMPKECLRNLTRDCLEKAPVSVPFVTKDPDTFSNTYFQKLLLWNDRHIKFGEVAFIPTDVALVVDVGLRKYVQLFAGDEEKFLQVFTMAYQKLVDATATSVNRY